jgi:enamine deaminase RidA (YjgF/YER057c/UK114 family)
MNKEFKMANHTDVRLLIPDTMPKSSGYSQLAIASGGSLVFVAGQVALDKSGNIVGRATSGPKFSRSLRTSNRRSRLREERSMTSSN